MFSPEQIITIIITTILVLSPVIMLSYVLLERFHGKFSKKRALAGYIFTTIMITLEVIALTTFFFQKSIECIPPGFKFNHCSITGFPFKYLETRFLSIERVDYLLLFLNFAIVFIFLMSAILLIDKVVTSGKSRKT